MSHSEAISRQQGDDVSRAARQDHRGAGGDKCVDEIGRASRLL